MRTPLLRMIVRTCESDSRDRDQVVSSRLNSHSSPVGGAFGPVRSSGKKNHQGWDLAAPIGTQAFAISDGVVEWTHAYNGNANTDPYGNQVCIRLGLSSMEGVQPRFAFYAHLSQYFVHMGDVVQEGQCIGLVGRTANAAQTPSHLHFEIRTDGHRYIPKGLAKRVDPGTILGFQYYSSNQGD